MFLFLIGNIFSTPSIYLASLFNNFGWYFPIFLLHLVLCLVACEDAGVPDKDRDIEKGTRQGRKMMTSLWKHWVWARQRLDLQGMFWRPLGRGRWGSGGDGEKWSLGVWELRDVRAAPLCHAASLSSSALLSLLFAGPWEVGWDRLFQILLHPEVRSSWSWR